MSGTTVTFLLDWARVITTPLNPSFKPERKSGLKIFSMDYISDDDQLPTSEFDIDAFRKETEIIHLIIYRNRNQHHVSYWWRYLDMLHQRCFQIIDEYDKLKHKRERERLNRNIKSKKRSDIRIPIWVESKKIGRIALFLYSKLIPSAHRNFHAMLAQGAFITLGMALVGAAARIYKVIVPVVLASKKGIEAAQRRKLRTSRLAKAEDAQATETLKQSEGRAEAMNKVDSIVLKATEKPYTREFDIGESVSREEVSAASQGDAGNDLIASKDSEQSDEVQLTGSGVKRALPFIDLNDDIPAGKSKKAKIKTKESKKKKKSKKNAIDSIFGDL